MRAPIWIAVTILYVLIWTPEGVRCVRRAEGPTARKVQAVEVE